MRTSRHCFYYALITSVVALIGLAAYQSHAIGQMTARPSAVGTVNLEKVFEGLEDRSNVDARLTAMAEDLKEQSDEQAHAIDGLNEELDAYPTGSDMHQRTMEKLQLASLEFQAFAEFSRRKIDVEKSLVLSRIYQSIKESARTLAVEQGYDVIFVNDSLAPLGSGTEEDVRRQISARRMLYTNPEIDLTAMLIERMNADFSVGG